MSAFSLLFPSGPAHPVRMGCSSYAVPPTIPCKQQQQRHPAEGLADGTPLGSTKDPYIGEAPFWVAPNGMAYVSPIVRPGILPRMLSEILNTRIMVKGAMKRWAPSSKTAAPTTPAAETGGAQPAGAVSPPPGGAAGAGTGAMPARVLQRVLNARQFSLKMISNVTYGYTSASFSGRMPFAELADTIVQSGERPEGGGVGG